MCPGLNLWLMLSKREVQNQPERKKREVRLRNSKSTVRGVLNPSGLRIYPLNLKSDHTGRKEIVDFDLIKRENSPVIRNLITGLFFTKLNHHRR